MNISIWNHRSFIVLKGDLVFRHTQYRTFEQEFRNNKESTKGNVIFSIF